LFIVESPEFIHWNDLPIGLSAAGGILSPRWRGKFDSAARAKVSGAPEWRGDGMQIPARIVEND
jgi:hypothetical protein